MTRSVVSFICEGDRVWKAHLKARGVGDADHVASVVACPGHCVGRPAAARDRRHRVDALVRVYLHVHDALVRV